MTVYALVGAADDEGLSITAVSDCRPAMSNTSLTLSGVRAAGTASAVPMQ